MKKQRAREASRSEGKKNYFIREALMVRKKFNSLAA